MSAADFSKNLRLLCSYGKSISAICHDAGINRHQIKRYLAGTASPSLHTLQRLCDFFGLEEHEILLRHEEFAALVRLKPPKLQKTRDRIAEFVGNVADELDLKVAQHYTGYYFVYFQPDRHMSEIHRALMLIKLEDGCLITNTVERYPSGSAGLPKTVKYKGVAFLNGRNLMVMERRLRTPDVMFYSLLYGADTDELTYLSGLATGASPDSSRTLYAVRICWQYLGKKINIRETLRICGQIPIDSPGISNYVRFCTVNDLSKSDSIFAPRF